MGRASTGESLGRLSRNLSALVNLVSARTLGYRDQPLIVLVIVLVIVIEVQGITRRNSRGLSRNQLCLFWRRRAVAKTTGWKPILQCLPARRAMSQGSFDA